MSNIDFKVFNDIDDLQEEREWEQNRIKETPLEELLYWDTYSNFDENEYLPEGWGGMPFEYGDIVLLNDENGGISGHKVYIITSLIDPENGPEFEGFVMSSQVQKANVNNPKYPANILIKNYGSILTKNSYNKDIIIKIDQRFELDSSNFVAYGALQGQCKEAFKKFLNAVVLKYENGKDTSNDYWDNGIPHIERY